ncbi:MAG: orotate phosphoribosyltransferase [Rhizobiales bacterium]|nr:orotate phosphoribosyltransferase [Hyphomicrobiales bacterium]
MDKKQLAKEIGETCWITGEFKLRSGQISSDYFDKYRFEALPHLLVPIATLMAEKIAAKDDTFFALAGLELGGVPIATAIGIQNGMPSLFVRKKAKEYGTCQFAEGLDFKGKKLVIIEDVVTTGGQIIESTKMLREAGAIVEQVICVLLRDKSGIEKLAAEGLTLDYVFSREDFE